ncbi:hypothetical protein RB213_008509, partial [Colletotrichum asianum]
MGVTDHQPMIAEKEKAGCLCLGCSSRRKTADNKHAPITEISFPYPHRYP